MTSTRTALVTGAASVGQALTDHPDIAQVSFTGGIKTGKKVMASASASTLKEVTMELGGKSPLIIFDDADLDKAADIAMMANFYSAGQVCTNGTRVFIPKALHKAFEAKVLERVKRIRSGDPTDENVNFGPLVSFAHMESVLRYIESGKREGATLLTGGNSLEGSFFEPTILINVPKNAAVAKEETFGPLASLFRFKDEAEVIAMANDTEFGLASYFYARDLSRVFRVAEALEYGMVGVNTGLISNEVAPFGGIKASGLGREGSKYGIEDYLEIKYLCLGI